MRQFIVAAIALLFVLDSHAAEIRLKDGSVVIGTIVSLVDGEDLSERIARGPIPADEATRIAGWRIAISALTLDQEPADTDDSGPATLENVSVDASVESLVLKDVSVSDGFRISELAATS